MVMGIFAISKGTLRSTFFKIILKFMSYPLHLGAILYCIFWSRYYIAFFGQRTSHTNHKAGYKGVGAPRVRNPLKTYFAQTFLCLIVRESPVNLFLRFNPFIANYFFRVVGPLESFGEIRLPFGCLSFVRCYPVRSIFQSLRGSYSFLCLFLSFLGELQ